MLIGGTVEMHLLTARLPVFWKQREMRFYPVGALWGAVGRLGCGCRPG